MKFCLWKSSAAVPYFMSGPFSELKRLKSHRVSSSFLVTLIFDVAGKLFCRKSSGGLGRKHSQQLCGSEVHVLILITVTDTPLLTKEEGHLYEVCLLMSFSVGIASAISVLLCRENVIATHSSCQERVKSSGKQWKSHIIFNYLINYRSKPFMIIMLMECHCYSTCVIYRERKPFL